MAEKWRQAVREVLHQGLKHLEEMKQEMCGDDFERTDEMTSQYRYHRKLWENAGFYEKMLDSLRFLMSDPFLGMNCFCSQKGSYTSSGMMN